MTLTIPEVKHWSPEHMRRCTPSLWVRGMTEVKEKRRDSLKAKREPESVQCQIKYPPTPAPHTHPFHSWHAHNVNWNVVFSVRRSLYSLLSACFLEREERTTVDAWFSTAPWKKTPGKPTYPPPPIICLFSLFLLWWLLSPQDSSKITPTQARPCDQMHFSDSRLQ